MQEAKTQRSPKLLMRGIKGARSYDVVVDGALLGKVTRAAGGTWLAGIYGEGILRMFEVRFLRRKLAVDTIVRSFYPRGLP